GGLGGDHGGADGKAALVQRMGGGPGLGGLGGGGLGLGQPRGGGGQLRLGGGEAGAQVGAVQAGEDLAFGHLVVEIGLDRGQRAGKLGRDVHPGGGLHGAGGDDGDHQVAALHRGGVVAHRGRSGAAAGPGPSGQRQHGGQQQEPEPAAARAAGRERQLREVGAAGGIWQG